MKKTLILFTLLIGVTLAKAQFELPVCQPKFILITQPKIQEHLKLTDEQKAKLKSVMDGVVEHDGEGRTMIKLSGDTDLDALNKDSLAVLNPDQAKRFSELYAQKNGYIALSLKEYADKIGVTEAQKSKLDEVWNSHREKMQAFFMENSPGSRELKIEREDMKKIDDETKKRAEAVLTEEQVAKWKTLLGATYEFEDDKLQSKF